MSIGILRRDAIDKEPEASPVIGVFYRCVRINDRSCEFESGGDSSLRMCLRKRLGLNCCVVLLFGGREVLAVGFFRVNLRFFSG